MFPGIFLLGSQIPIETPRSSMPSLDERIAYLKSYVEMALLDGVLTSGEKDYLTELGLKLQIPVKEVEKVIQEQLKKSQAKLTSSIGGRPVLDILRNHFEFLNVRAGASAADSFVISNTGGGVLSGTVKSNRKWLKVSQDSIDTNRHKQDIIISVETANLPLGFRDTGKIEIDSNGGFQVVDVGISTEIPKAALSRFRRSLALISLPVGSLLGAFSLAQFFDLVETGFLDSGKSLLVGFVVPGLMFLVGIGYVVILAAKKPFFSRHPGAATGCGCIVVPTSLIFLLVLLVAWPILFSMIVWISTCIFLLVLITSLVAPSLFRAIQTNKIQMLTKISAASRLVSPIVTISVILVFTSIIFGGGSGYYETGRLAGYLWESMDYKEGLLEYGEHLWIKGENQDAISVYTRIIEKDRDSPDSAKAYAARAQIYMEMKRYQDAISDYTAVIRLDPDTYNIGYMYKYRGYCYQAIGNNSQAQKNLAKAKSLGVQ